MSVDETTLRVPSAPQGVHLMAEKSESKTVERSTTTSGEKTGKAVDDSSIEAPPTSEVLTTSEAVETIERNSDPDGPSPRSY